MSTRAPSGSPRRIEVVCFGEILWDLFERPAAGEPRRYMRELGGAAANVATGLARLGVAVSLVGAVGKDRFGDELVQSLEGASVDTRGVVRLPARTGLTFVTRDAQGEPRFLPYRTGTADSAFEAGHVEPGMARARWVVVGTGALLTPSLAEATARFLALAESAGASVFVDLNARAHQWPSARKLQNAASWLVARAAIVKGSDADLTAIAGSRGLAWLAKKAPSASWIVTRQSGDATAYGKHGEVVVPARRARCVDATGAGDAFAAGFVAALVAAGARPGRAAFADPKVFQAALELGHRLGARAVVKVGGSFAADAHRKGLYAARARIEKMRAATAKRRTT